MQSQEQHMRRSLTGRLIIRCLSSSSSSSLAQAPNLRTLVRPFIKAIHPDLLPADAPAAARQANIACLQALNGLLDQLHKLREGGAARAVELPTRTALEFYVQRGGDMRRSTAMIKIPAQLRGGFGPGESVEQLMRTVGRQFENLNALVGAQAPSEAADATQQEQRYADAPVTDMLSSWYSQLRSEGYTTLEESAKAMTERATLLQVIAGTQTKDVLESHVLGFIRANRLILHNIDDETAEEAVQKLRAFLCEFGNEINFSLRTWAKVIVVLGDYKKPGLVTREGWFLLQVPVNLKPMRLLKFIVENLPCANFLAYDPLDPELNKFER